MIPTFVLYLLLPAVQIAFYLQVHGPESFAEGANYCASILALHWLLANVLIAGKIPFFQKSLPYDLRIRLHIFSSAGIAVAVFYHAVFKIAVGRSIDPPTWTLTAVIVFLFLLAVLWIPVPGFREFRERLLRKMKARLSPSYDRLKSLHGLFVLGLGFLLLIHITGAELTRDVNYVSALLYWLLFGAAFAVYLLSKTRLFLVKAEILEVKESRGILTIYLKPQKRLLYKSGQFAFLRARIGKGRFEEHPFSFLSSPAAKVSGTNGAAAPVSFGIRAIGDFTGGLALLNPGDRVWIKGPFGDFRPRKEPALCFIASGIGTVPVISLLKELHAARDPRPVKVFLAVNHRDEIQEPEELRRIADAMPNLEIRRMVFSEDGLKFSEAYFRETLADPRSYSYYLCSSPGVRRAVLEALRGLGVKKSLIRFEAFSFG